MRIRSIKPEFFKHDGVAAMRPLTRILFVGLWCLADCEGRLEDRPQRIKIEVLPYDDYDVEQGLAEIEQAGFIERYDTDTAALIQVINFRKHQRISGKESQYRSQFPANSAGKTKRPRVKQQGSTRESSGIFTESQETEQGDGDGKVSARKRASSEDATLALEIYNAYPRKVAKIDALRAIQKVFVQFPLRRASLLGIVQRYAAAVAQWPESEQRFIPHPATWFNQGRYEDDPATWRKDPIPGRRTAADIKSRLSQATQEFEELTRPGGCAHPIRLEGEKLARAETLQLTIRTLKKELASA